jgi:hypothetical protein
MVGSCEYGDEPSGSGATELVSYNIDIIILGHWLCVCSGARAHTE